MKTYEELIICAHIKNTIMVDTIDKQPYYKILLQRQLWYKLQNTFLINKSKNIFHNVE